MTKKSAAHKKEKDTKQKIVWLWACVSIIMATVIFFWATTVPNHLKLDNTSDTTGRLFKENKNKLSELFNQNKSTWDFISATPSLYDTVLKAVASSTSAASSTLGLTPEQLENLKNKIDKK